VRRSEKGNPLDLRAWLDEARKLGEVKDVRGADWNLELGAISELNVKKESPPALLFDEIAGYPKGFRVLTCSTSSPGKLSSILRLGVEKVHHDLVQKLRGKPAFWQSEAVNYDPVYMEKGPVLENIKGDGKVDLYTFPSPFWHEKDGGRYIGTGCCVVTRDFDSDWVNVGTYRVQVHDRATVGLDMVPGKHGAIQYEKYMKAGKPFPVAIVCGCDPLGYLVSGIEVPFGMCEYNYIGAILGEPVSVVKTQLTGLPVPAASEIVLEGWAHPGDVRIEGPFGEFHGYYPGKAATAPAVRIERIYYRNDPIMVGSPPAVAIKQRYAGHAKQAGHILNQCGIGAYMSRYSVVVDEDIDPSNLQEVMWAVATRTDPVVDIDIIQRGMGSKNDPMYVAYQYQAPFSSKAIIDACRPYDHLHEFPEVAEASKELQEKVRAKWRDLF
jgi:3-polyprenyl-4-hydroxybenzoate decarboxylase